MVKVYSINLVGNKSKIIFLGVIIDDSIKKN